MEARWRVEDPVYGSTGIIHSLQEEILAAQCELARTRAHLDIVATQLQHQAPAPLAQPLHSPQRADGHHQTAAVAQRHEEAPFPDPTDEFLNLDGI
jgi:hypothetical protein